MPSSSETPRLGLNQWLGDDKPKRSDFNGDNSRLDAACGNLLDAQAGLEARCGQLAAENGDISQRCTELSSFQETMLRDLNLHMGNGAVHVTLEEKEKWEKGGFYSNLYLGDGQASQTVNIGFLPEGGFLFPVNRPPVRPSTIGAELYVYNGFFSAYGCTRGITVNEKGFQVSQSVSPGEDNVALCLNESGVRYAYFVWK